MDKEIALKDNQTKPLADKLEKSDEQIVQEMEQVNLTGIQDKSQRVKKD